jgi:hypothetical protein
VVPFSGNERPGTIVVDTPQRFLYLVQDDGTALRYGIGVGRPGFTWAGVKAVTRKAEWPEAELAPTKYWLGDLPPSTTLRRLVRVAKCRWAIEQDYQQLKEELGLDHYEGRGWIGWHHHLTLVMLAHAFLTLETLRRKKNFWVDAPADAP